MARRWIRAKVNWEMLDNEFELMAIAQQIAEIAAKAPFTIRDDEIFRLELCRRVGLDGFGTDRFDEAAQAAGVSPHALRTFINDHDHKGHLAGKDRQAWSQAKRKVAATLGRLPGFNKSLPLRLYLAEFHKRS